MIGITQATDSRHGLSLLSSLAELLKLFRSRGYRRAANLCLTQAGMHPWSIHVCTEAATSTSDQLLYAAGTWKNSYQRKSWSRAVPFRESRLTHNQAKKQWNTQTLSRDGLAGSGFRPPPPPADPRGRGRGWRRRIEWEGLQVSSTTQVPNLEKDL